MDDRGIARSLLLLKKYHDKNLFDDTPKEVQLLTQHFVDRFVSMMYDQHLRQVDY